MAEYYTILTDIGLAKLANAVPAGMPISFTEVAVGDGNGTVYNPAQGQTALAREVYRMPINQIYVDPNNPAWLVVEAVIPASVGGWYVREAGIYDDDDDLIAISKFPETFKPALDSGAGKDLYLRLILEHSNVGNVTLQIDPAIVLATRKYVDDHAAITATTSRRGHVELATDAETQAGTDTQRAVTPASLSSRTATDGRTGLVELATAAEVLSGTDDTRAVTPAGLAARTATTSRAGLVELATAAEVQAGTDNSRGVTPAGLAALLATLAASTEAKGLVELATAAEFNTGTDATRALTASLFAKSISGNGYIKLPGGLVVQWLAPANREDGSSFTWPIAFPAALLFASAVHLSGGVTAPQYYAIRSVGLTGGLVFLSSAAQNTAIFGIGR